MLRFAPTRTRASGAAACPGAAPPLARAAADWSNPGKTAPAASEPSGNQSVVNEQTIIAALRKKPVPDKELLQKLDSLADFSVEDAACSIDRSFETMYPLESIIPFVAECGDVNRIIPLF